MSKAAVSLLKGILKDLKPFMENQDNFRLKSIEVGKKVKTRLNKNPELKFTDFTEELVSLEKFYFFDSLLGQSTNKLASQASILYQLCILEKLDLGLSEDEVLLLERLKTDDFNLFTYEGNDIKLLNNEYTSSILKSIESKNPKVREAYFNNMLQDPEFLKLEV